MKKGGVTVRKIERAVASRAGRSSCRRAEHIRVGSFADGIHTVTPSHRPQKSASRLWPLEGPGIAPVGRKGMETSQVKHEIEGPIQPHLAKFCDVAAVRGGVR
jgi:hypothetical protein